MLRILLIVSAAFWVAPVWAQQANAELLKIDDSLANTDPKDKVRANSWHKVHPFRMTAGKSYTIDMTSSQFDPYLRLEDAKGAQLAQDDDGGDFTNARIFFTAPRTEEYRIIATSFSSGTGKYTLTVHEGNRANLAPRFDQFKPQPVQPFNPPVNRNQLARERAMDPFGGVFMGSSILLSFLLLPNFLLGLAIPYAILRLRDAHSPMPDPQLGLKAGLHFFNSLGILWILLALTIVVVDLIMQLDIGGPGQQFFQWGNEPFPNQPQRVAFGLAISGILFIIVHMIFLLMFTSDPWTSPVRRTFLGWRFAINGLVVLMAISGLIILLVQKENANLNEPRKFLIAVLLVWMPSWFIHLTGLARLSRRSPLANLDELR